MQKEKIAICFFGQVRFYESFNLFYPELLKILSDYDVDFFMSTWNDCDESKINLNFIKKEFLNLEDTNIKEADAHTKKSMYLISRVGMLKRQYELEKCFSYDKVILIRPDIAFNLGDFNTKIKKVDFKTEDRPTVYTALPFEHTYLKQEEIYIPKLSEDWFFMFSSDAFDVHTTLYNSIYLTQRWRYSPHRFIIGGHWNHLFYFKYFNFNVKSLDLGTAIVRPTRDLDTYKLNFCCDNLLEELIIEGKKWRLNEETEELINQNGLTVPFKGSVL